MPCRDNIFFPSSQRSIGYGIGGAGGGFSSITGVNTAGPRTFFIAGIKQQPIEAGIVMLPTSEDISVGSTDYITGSSQFYTVGEVHWNGTKRVQGVDWELVSPFNHIIHILINKATITTPVQLIYYRWDIGVRIGFRVTSYPVPFAFEQKSIIAEQVPPPNTFFTVQYTSTRPGNNAVTLFALYPILIDDILTDHLTYDGLNGFDTYRPTGYTVFETLTNRVFEWNGTTWMNNGLLAVSAKFYVKRTRTIYTYTGIGVVESYVAGDPLTVTIPEALGYPSFGESVGNNLLADAFSANAINDFPSAYVIGQRPGVYDEWLDI